MTGTWSGRKVMAARAVVATWLPAPCGQCGETVDGSSAWVVGHKLARSTHPELTWSVANWRPEHRPCSDASTAGVKRELAAMGTQNVRTPGSPFIPHAGGTERLRTSDIPLPNQIVARPELAWSPSSYAAYPWLEPYLEVPSDAAPPLWMSPPPDDAVGSYGAVAIAWIESSQNITLRFWQKLGVVRQLEHRADGSLCHRTVVESAPRRSGKSVRLRGLALWRMSAGPVLFGEPQLVMHTGSDVAICREVQRGAWRWAEETADWTVSRANGKEAIETPDGDRWLVRAQNSVYGYDCCLGLVDEGWNVKPDTVTEGLEPATLERSSPQVHLTSTAHRRATSLMRSQLTSALTVADPEVLVMVWGAPPGADPSDPDVWRAASPHWSEDRRRMIASKYEKAAAGELDPQADDPDPLAGFTSQYLNVWRLREPRLERGEPVVESESWSALVADVPLALPDAVAIESWFREGVSLALAWRTGDQVVVTCADFRDLDSLVVALRETGFKGTATVGAGLMGDPALAKVRKVKGVGTVVAAAGDLGRLLSEGVLGHDGGEHLAGQVVALRTVPAADGVRMASTKRADAVKAAVWAAQSARRTRAGSSRILLPTGTT